MIRRKRRRTVEGLNSLSPRRRNRTGWVTGRSWEEGICEEEEIDEEKGGILGRGKLLCL